MIYCIFMLQSNPKVILCQTDHTVLFCNYWLDTVHSKREHWGWTIAAEREKNQETVVALLLSSACFKMWEFLSGWETYIPPPNSGG